MSSSLGSEGAARYNNGQIMSSGSVILPENGLNGVEHAFHCVPLPKPIRKELLKKKESGTLVSLPLTSSVSKRVILKKYY